MIVRKVMNGFYCGYFIDTAEDVAPPPSQILGPSTVVVGELPIRQRQKTNKIIYALLYTMGYNFLCNHLPGLMSLSSYGAVRQDSSTVSTTSWQCLSFIIVMMAGLDMIMVEPP
jgi:hypothetical protein